MSNIRIRKIRTGPWKGGYMAMVDHWHCAGCFRRQFDGSFLTYRTHGNVTMRCKSLMSAARFASLGVLPKDLLPIYL